MGQVGGSAKAAKISGILAVILLALGWELLVILAGIIGIFFGRRELKGGEDAISDLASYEPTSIYAKDLNVDLYASAKTGITMSLVAIIMAVVNIGLGLLKS